MIKLPFTKAIYNIVARKTALKNPTFANKKLNVGLCCENTVSIKQIPFLTMTNRESIKTPTVNHKYEEGETTPGKGSMTIPDTKDFYMGESV